MSVITLGMTGPIGHGKSTFAKAVKTLEPSSVHFESSMVIAEVANAMHASLQQIPNRDDINSINNWLKSIPVILLQTVHVQCGYEQIKLDIDAIELHPIEYEKLLLHIENLTRDPSLARNEITKENKETYRPLLQWLGGYLVKKVEPGIWYKEIIRRVEEAKKGNHKVCLIGGLRFPTDAALVRQAGGIIVRVYRPDHLQYDKLDPTERERDNIHPDTTVISNGTIDDINRLAGVVLADIPNNKLQKIYYAAGTSKTV